MNTPGRHGGLLEHPTLPASQPGSGCPATRCFPLRSRSHLEGHSKAMRVPASSSQLLPRLSVCRRLGLGQSSQWWSQMTARHRASLQSTSLLLPAWLHGSFCLSFWYLSLFNFFLCSYLASGSPVCNLHLRDTRSSVVKTCVSVGSSPASSARTHFSEEFL